ncbi:DUF4215 domain-containing protein [Leptospira soteropolitanensis]|uniref:DUF4215 domain-containing protein n=1 Tax=Leptospira soteropolitanensis TaxID=2950025 RepID=UPI00223E1D2C|nr:DUF4215 domain-containing protein [Leptospira soteropolitanensis]
MKYSFLKKFVFSLISLVGILGCDLVSSKDDGKNIPVELVALVVATTPASPSTPPSNLSYAGTPTVNQALSNYTITAANSFGSTSATISIQVKDAVCGNGVIEGNEVCDDNNATNGDGCNNTCSGA